MSAGNHAQAVAYHARRLGIPATIVMPDGDAAREGREHPRATARRVVLARRDPVEAAEKARALAAERGLVFVHPYDDALVMAGQGTVALEMLEDAPDLDQIVVPIGGGGLISGIAVAAKALKPAIEIIGVEAALYPSFHNAIRGEDRPIGGPTLAEGIAVKTVGELTAADRARPRLATSSSSTSADRARGQRLRDAPAHHGGGRRRGGARGDAGASPICFAGRRVGLVLCGGNIDARLLASVMVRELERDDRIASFRITSQRPAGLPRPGGEPARRARRQHPRGLARPPLPRRAGQGGDHRRDDRDPRTPGIRRRSSRRWRRDGLDPQRLDPRGLSETAY